MSADARRGFRATLSAGLRALAGPTLPLPPSAGLRCCPACGRDRIAVLERSQHGSSRLELLRLRCGECGLLRDAVVTRSEALALLALHATHRQQIAGALVSLDDITVEITDRRPQKP